jgi:hypothetical protein
MRLGVNDENRDTTSARPAGSDSSRHMRRDEGSCNPFLRQRQLLATTR